MNEFELTHNDLVDIKDSLQDHNFTEPEAINQLHMEIAGLGIDKWTDKFRHMHLNGATFDELYKYFDNLVLQNV